MSESAAAKHNEPGTRPSDPTTLVAQEDPSTLFAGRGSSAARIKRGKAARTKVPRAKLADCKIEDRDPIALLEASNAGRVTELIPIRYGRMVASPFASPPKFVAKERKAIVCPSPLRLGSELAALAIEEAGRQLEPGRDALVLTVWRPFAVGFIPPPGVEFDAAASDEVRNAAEQTAAHGASMAAWSPSRGSAATASVRTCGAKLMSSSCATTTTCRSGWCGRSGR